MEAEKSQDLPLAGWDLGELRVWLQSESEGLRARRTSGVSSSLKGSRLNSQEGSVSVCI